MIASKTFVALPRILIDALPIILIVMLARILVDFLE
jgi:hypothetical protein